MLPAAHRAVGVMFSSENPNASVERIPRKGVTYEGEEEDHEEDYVESR
jgi:hypothetical protein